MIDLKLYMAVLHTPKEVILIGIYQDRYDVLQAMKDEVKKHIKNDDTLTDNDFFMDWEQISVGDTCNRVLYEKEGEK